MNSDKVVSAPRLSVTMLHSIDRSIENIFENGTAKDVGQQLAVSGFKNTQVRGLENLIASTTRFSEIVNYIKNQIGKEKGKKREDFKWRNVGSELLRQLESIEKEAAEIVGSDMAAKLEVKLRLARGWAKQIVAHYLYSVSENMDNDNLGDSHDDRTVS